MFDGMKSTLLSNLEYDIHLKKLDSILKYQPKCRHTLLNKTLGNMCTDDSCSQCYLNDTYFKLKDSLIEQMNKGLNIDDYVELFKKSTYYCKSQHLKNCSFCNNIIHINNNIIKSSCNHCYHVECFKLFTKITQKQFCLECMLKYE